MGDVACIGMREGSVYRSGASRDGERGDLIREEGAGPIVHGGATCTWGGTTMFGGACGFDMLAVDRRNHSMLPDVRAVSLVR